MSHRCQTRVGRNLRGDPFCSTTSSVARTFMARILMAMNSSVQRQDVLRSKTDHSCMPLSRTLQTRNLDYAIPRACPAIPRISASRVDHRLGKTRGTSAGPRPIAGTDIPNGLPTTSPFPLAARSGEVRGIRHAPETPLWLARLLACLFR